jgi:predicted nucleotidyltransferase
MRIAVDLPVLTAAERGCLERYVDRLVESLGEQLLEVFVYGSVARGESWPQGMPIRSDLDLLVITKEPVPAEVVDELVDATLPLFLESGRQLGPVFRTADELERPPTDRMRRFVAEFRRDALRVYGR